MVESGHHPCPALQHQLCNLSRRAAASLLHVHCCRHHRPRYSRRSSLVGRPRVCAPPVHPAQQFSQA
eukprot:455979-Prymnesium_polylepis.1